MNMRLAVRTGAVTCAVVLASSPRHALAQAAPAKPPAATPAPGGSAPAARKPGTAAASAEFDRLVQEGTEARQAERWEDAIDLYARAVKIKPDYVEGYWYQGTAYYSLDNFTKGAETFRKVVRLAPKNGAAYAFLGLCEFGLKDYDRSLQHLLQSRILGVGDTADLGNVARYHAAILMTRMEQFEQALETLGEFASEGNDNPRVIEAMGVATLRMAMLPTEAPPDRREMVLMAGRASYMMATRNTASAAKAFEALVARYPETPNVHYAYGVFLLQEQPDKAIEEFKTGARAAAGACVVVDADRLRVPEGERGRRRCPGRNRRRPQRPTRSLRTRRSARRCSRPVTWTAPSKSCRSGSSWLPTAPGLHFTLAKAYQRAGRAEDAAREREEFTRLDRLGRTRAAASNRSADDSSRGFRLQPEGHAT